jgi:hypothetical protein
MYFFVTVSISLSFGKSGIDVIILKNIFAEKFGGKIGVFCSKQS